jgi:predicted DNA-binding transcriptional regulator YafY
VRHTRTQTTHKTLTDLFKALDRQHAVTVTYLEEEKDGHGRKTGRLVETVRTVEISGLATTTAGNILVHHLDRKNGEPRTFRLDRLRSYTLHRSSPYRLLPPATDETTDAPVLTTELDVIAWEISREEPEYWTEFRSQQALAA